MNCRQTSMWNNKALICFKVDIHLEGLCKITKPAVKLAGNLV